MHNYDYIIVGSGAGGATLARELSKKGKEILVLERGNLEGKLGSFSDATRYYDCTKITNIPKKSQEGVILWHTFMAGGTTMVSAGNIVRSLESELESLGIDLGIEFSEAEREMKVDLIDDRLISAGSIAIAGAAKELGYNFVKMPKAIDPVKCIRCAHCVLGCRHGAKWTALDYLQEALANGAEIKYGATVKKVIIVNGKAIGVQAETPDGAEEFQGRVVIVAAGGLATPVILQNSGIKEAGTDLFIDIQVHTYGATNGVNLLREPQMALVNLDFHKTDGFLLSPFVNQPRQVRFIEIGPQGFALSTGKMIGLMTKIADEGSGRVFPDGKVSKPLAATDWIKIKKGTAIAREILTKAGADPNSIIDTKPAGSHAGGTAGIGRVVNNILQTKADNLFVCDASVLPLAPGLPPILTIVALAKRLAKTLD